MRWMLDTDTCIALIRRHEGALRRIRGKSVGQVGISSITLGELAHGAYKSQRSVQARAALQDFVASLEIADFDQYAAMQYGAVRAALAARGRPIGALDNLIAGHALAVDAVIVTHNTREFSRVEGLRVEDWLSDG